jgi:hypothetical protein
MPDAAKIRLADTPPAACSSCFGQYPDRRHVDFGASWDGPFLTGQVTGATTVSIDDLVICDGCLTIAARELGLVEPGEMKQALMDAAAAQETLAERLYGALRYIQTLEQTVNARDDLEEKLGLKRKEPA